MVKYTDGFTEFLTKALPCPVNTEFVGYREQFGGEFVGEMLSDGVHLDPTAQETLSGFVLSLLDKGPTGAIPAMANRPSFVNIIVNNGVKAIGEEEMEDAS